VEKTATADGWAPQDVAAIIIAGGGGRHSSVSGTPSLGDEREGEAFALGHLAESNPQPTGSARGVTLETGGEGEAGDLEWTACGRVEVEYWSLEWGRRGGEGEGTQAEGRVGKGQRSGSFWSLLGFVFAFYPKKNKNNKLIFDFRLTAVN